MSCQPSTPLSVGIFLVTLLFACTMSWLASPQYILEFDRSHPRSELNTSVKHGLLHTCFKTSYSHHCLDQSDAELDVEGMEPFQTRSKLTLMFLLITAVLAASILLLAVAHFLCGLIDLKVGAPWILLIILATLQIGVSFATASIPTSEFISEKRKFNNLETRAESYWQKVLQKAMGSDAFDKREQSEISLALESAKFQIKMGWVLPVMWVASCLAFIALICFAVAHVINASFLPHADEKSGLLPELYQKGVDTEKGEESLKSTKKDSGKSDKTVDEAETEGKSTKEGEKLFERRVSEKLTVDSGETEKRSEKRPAISK